MLSHNPTIQHAAFPPLVLGTMRHDAIKPAHTRALGGSHIASLHWLFHLTFYCLHAQLRLLASTRYAYCSIVLPFPCVEYRCVRPLCRMSSYPLIEHDSTCLSPACYPWYPVFAQFPWSPNEVHACGSPLCRCIAICGLPPLLLDSGVASPPYFSFNMDCILMSEKQFGTLVQITQGHPPGCTRLSHS